MPGPRLPHATLLPRPETWDRRLFRWFANATGALVVLYLFFDRGAAHLHIPHTQAFLAEMLLTFGAIVAACGTHWIRQAMHKDMVLKLLLSFMIWGLLRTIPNVPTFGLEFTVRDAALWYYGAFAIMIVAACEAVPDLPSKFVRGFSRVVPWLTLWLPAALLLERSGVKGPHFRYSNVPLLSHKPGNICVAAAICLVWLWLVPGQRHGRLVRLLLSTVDLFTILFGATQTRGGGLAALVGVALGLALMGRARSIIVVSLCGILLAVLVIGGLTGVAYHTQKRTISVAQLFLNAESVSGGEVNNPQLSGSVSFRESLWTTLLRRQSQTSHLIDGFGFGPDLANIGGVVSKQPSSAAAEALTSAHNSWLDVLARTGLIGALLWLLFWILWYRRMAWGRRRAIANGDAGNRGVIEVCLVGCTAILINCFFDPTLEGAQVAVLNFTLVAMGIVCARHPFIVSAGPRSRRLGSAAPPAAGPGFAR